MRRTAFTLVELMLAVALTGLVMGAILTAYIRAAQVLPRLRAQEQQVDQDRLFRTTVTSLLHHAYVLNNGANVAVALGGARTYFTTNPQGTNTGLTQAGGGQSNTGTSNSSGAGAAGSTLVFTTLGEPTSQAALQDPSNDFVQQNQVRGPVGGVVEYELSLTPVGNAADKQGVFLRKQRPADTDPTQGGYEKLLDPGIDYLLFEFWDGTQWQQSWDTTTQTPIRLPAGGRVTYSSGNATPSVFVVQIPLSDATPANPVTNFGNAATTGASQ